MQELFRRTMRKLGYWHQDDVTDKITEIRIDERAVHDRVIRAQVAQAQRLAEEKFELRMREIVEWVAKVELMRSDVRHEKRALVFTTYVDADLFLGFPPGDSRITEHVFDAVISKKIMQDYLHSDLFHSSRPWDHRETPHMRFPTRMMP